MTADFLRRVFVRDMSALRDELRAYRDERDIWRCPPGIQNSAGTLALHAVGNLQHYIGAQLGDTGYVRDRVAEFADRDVPVQDLEKQIDQTIAAVEATLSQMDSGQLQEEFPVDLAGIRLPTGLALLHLAVHLAYHLGQIDYHRRVVTTGAEAIGAQAVKGLTDGI